METFNFKIILILNFPLLQMKYILSVGENMVDTGNIK